MARKLIPLEEAAKTLGVSPDELNTMRENREVYGYRDGASWKFKPEDIERLAQELAERGSRPASDSSSLIVDVGDSDDEGEDIVLLSEGEQSPAAGGSSTIIGALAGAQSAEDSDIKLSTASDVNLGSGIEVIGGSSTVITKPKEPGEPESAVSIRLAGERDVTGSDVLPVSDSDMHPLAIGDEGSGKKGPGSDLTLFSEQTVGEGIGSDVLGGTGGESVFVTGGSSGKIVGGAPGSDLTIGGSDDDVFQLQDPAGSSSIRLADEPQSAGPGSDITISPGDSGINLIDPSDSGISLEEPLELSSADDESSFDLSSDSSGDSSGTLGDSAEFDSDAVMELQSEDEFLLTPLEESIDDESQDSGSQVIALDSDTDFEDASPTVMGPADAGAALLEPEEGAPDLGLGAAGLGLAAAPTLAAAPGTMVLAPGREAPYGILAMTLLTLSVIVLSLTGMMTFDLMRNIWSWDGAYTANSWIMDQIVGK
jgi:hypothetical protein